MEALVNESLHQVLPGTSNLIKCSDELPDITELASPTLLDRWFLDAEVEVTAEDEGPLLPDGDAFALLAPCGAEAPFIEPDARTAPVVAKNNKLALDARFNPAVLRLPTVRFNHYMKKGPGRDLSEQDHRDLRKARRRMKNREYAKRSREKRLAGRVAPGGGSVAPPEERVASLEADNLRLRAELERLRSQA